MIWKPIFFILFGIIINSIDAAGDAFKTSKNTTKFKKTLGWMSEDLILSATIIILPIMVYFLFDLSSFKSFIGDLSRLVITFVLLRISLFNIVWNFVRFIPENFKYYWWYFRGEKWYDIFLGWLILRSWFAVKFKPLPGWVVGTISITSFLFAIFVSSGLRNFIEK